MGLKRMVKSQLKRLCDIEYRKKRKQYQYPYASWLSALEQEADAEREAAYEADSGPQKPRDFVLVSFGEGSWDKKASGRIGRFFAANPQVLLAYGDEDVAQQGKEAGHPWLKPDWSPDSYLCRDYLGAAVAVRRELYEKLTEEERAQEQLCHDRLVSLAGGFEKGCRAIGHIKGVLYHRDRKWQLPGERPAGEVSEKREPEAMTGETAAAKEPLVSIIIPSKDNVSVLMQCLKTLEQTILRCPYEIIIVDNGSCTHTKEAVGREIEKLNKDLTEQDALKRAVYHYEPMEFNFSHMCNLGAKKAEGSLLLFLNDDIEAVEPGWLEAMAERAGKPWTGAVGIKLWYPDSDRIQHAGITNIGIGPVHKLQFLKDNKCYYDGRNRGVWNVLAVTGACLMVRKELFREAGGFSEKMRVAFNDVDLCFTLYEMGCHNVVLNTMHLLHHESLSRGADESEEKLKRLAAERKILYERHPLLEGRDPYYHPWLNGNLLDTRIVPSFEEGRLWEDKREGKPAEALTDARKDACLLLRIEYADKKKIQGYGVVLGSDNACFGKKLLFRMEGSPEVVYSMDFTQQYRPDLEENMPDQENIGLCGFAVNFACSLPPGEYRIGMLARDRISGGKLLNWSNRMILF